MEMKDKILNWFATGRVGASSKAMALAAIDMPNDGSYPHDPDDLNRCLLLLESVPEIRQRMDKIAAINETWDKLVNKWEEIERCFLNEVGLNWSKGRSAPKTYDMIISVTKAQKDRH